MKVLEDIYEIKNRRENHLINGPANIKRYIKRLPKIGMLYTPISFKIYAFELLYLWKRKLMDRDGYSKGTKPIYTPIYDQVRTAVRTDHKEDINRH